MPETGSRGGLNRKENKRWQRLRSRCVSSWKLAYTLVTTPAAGTRRWLRSSLARATVFTSSISIKPVRLLYRALEAVTATVSKGGRILFVGTKRAASEKVAEAAQRCGQYYVNHRWPGGMLTNWKTISQSIKRMRDIESTMESDDLAKLSKKEALMMSRDHAKLMRTLNGIRDMGGLPDLIFVLDTNKEHLAVAEAKVSGYSGCCRNRLELEPRQHHVPRTGQR